MEALKTVTISKRAELAAKGGHPWIYGSEIKGKDKGIEPGEIVRVLSGKGKFIGSGFYNEHSKITVRIISTNANDRFDDAFWKRRVSYALDYRLQVMRPEDYDNMRIIFGEADQLPGLTVDRFGDVLSVQVLSLGIEKNKDIILNSLIEVLRQHGLPVSCVYERNDVKIRELEGLTQYKGFFDSPLLNPEDRKTITHIVENGIHYDVDVENGQKTGFFLDQKYNRLAIQKLCKNAKVLDCFTHTGSFALNAGIAGAASVTGVDASQLAVDQATANATLNGLSDNVKFICEDVFELLPELEEKGEKFDVVILDPPAFTKSRNSIKNAVKGYREINLRAMKLVKDGGFLATCSCSHFMDYELFTKTIGQAAKNVHKRLRQVEYRTQAPDHPILWAADESYYLKFYIFQVCNDR